MELSLSDETMANLPSQILTEGTEMTATTLTEDSQDLFDSTLTGLITSTQISTSTKDNTAQTEATQGPEKKKTDLCLEYCKFKDNKPKKTDKIGPVQCYMCQHWIHPPCVGERDADIVNIWSCPSCRAVPDNLQVIMTMLENMKQENLSLKDLVTQKMNTIEHKLDNQQCKKCDSKTSLADKLSDTLQAKTKEHVDAVTEISRLRSELSELNCKLNSKTWSQFRDKDMSQNIVFGSSVVRDIQESHLQNTTMECIPGGCIKDIIKTVSAKPAKTYDQAVLVVGGNDCDTRDPEKARTPSDIVSEYRGLVKLTKSKASTVNVSSVCPRIKSSDVKNRIEAVNAGLQVMCEEEGVIFTDNSPSFHLQDGTINDGYLLKDGVHLTNKATNRLAQNLKLKMKKGTDSVCAKRQKTTTKMTKTREIDHVTSQQELTDFDTTHSFWSKARSKAEPYQRRQQTYVKPNRQTTGKPSTTTPSDRTRCYNCYETNHTERTCRHEQPLVCRECGSEGHKAKHHNHDSYNY